MRQEVQYVVWIRHSSGLQRRLDLSVFVYGERVNVGVGILSDVWYLFIRVFDIVWISQEILEVGEPG